jgi:hypothetical protein
MIIKVLFLFAAILSNKRAPEFLQPLQITKTRAGMQVC